MDSNHERDLIYINLVEFPDGFSVDALNEDSYLYSVEVIARGQAFRRMISKKTKNILVQRNEQHHRRVLLNSFRLNSRTLSTESKVTNTL